MLRQMTNNLLTAFLVCAGWIPYSTQFLELHVGSLDFGFIPITPTVVNVIAIDRTRTTAPSHEFHGLIVVVGDFHREIGQTG